MHYSLWSVTSWTLTIWILSKCPQKWELALRNCIDLVDGEWAVWHCRLTVFPITSFFWKKKKDETETKYESKPFSCPWKIFVALVTFSILNVPRSSLWLRTFIKSSFFGFAFSDIRSLIWIQHLETGILLFFLSGSNPGRQWPVFVNLLLFYCTSLGVLLVHLQRFYSAPFVFKLREFDRTLWWPFFLSIYRYMVLLWFNLEIFIIRRFNQFTDNFGAPFVIKMRYGPECLVPLVLPKDHVELSLNNNYCLRKEAYHFLALYSPWDKDQLQFRDNLWGRSFWMIRVRISDLRSLGSISWSIKAPVFYSRQFYFTASVSLTSSFEKELVISLLQTRNLKLLEMGSLSNQVRHHAIA